MSIIKDDENRARIESYSRELDKQSRELRDLKSERLILGILVVSMTIGMLIETNYAIKCETGRSLLTLLSHNRL